MDIINNVSKALNKTAKKAVKVSGSVVDYAKVTVEIKSGQAKIESFYKEIGKAIFKQYKTDQNSVPEDIADYCRCINEIGMSIVELKDKAAELRGIKRCVKCHKNLDLKYEFCPVCGEKQPEPKIEEEVCECEDECCCADEACDCGCEDEACDCGCDCDCGDDDCGCDDECDCGCDEGIQTEAEGCTCGMCAIMKDIEPPAEKE